MKRRSQDLDMIEHMRKRFTLDDLSDVQFEEYCYDLLDSMGFVNLNWRKGTGKGTSSSDSGRDIECEYVTTDPDGGTYTQKWYVECKHYKRGVPATAISNALDWAAADRPNFLLIVASNHLSNPTKDHLRAYEAQNRPAFRIKTWELPNLENYSKDKPLLLWRYGIGTANETLDLMHPAHLAYIQSPKFNRLETLFSLLDQLAPKDAEDITGWLWELILKPRRRKPLHKGETMGDLLLDKVDYETFKSKCYEIAATDTTDEVLLCFLVANYLLQELFSQGDITSIDAQVERHRDTIQFIKDLSVNEPDRFDKTEYVDDMVEILDRHIKEVPQRIARWHELYNIFCEQVITELLKEDVLRQK